MKSGSRVYIKGLAGVVYGITPEIKVSGGGNSVVVYKSASAGSLGFGFGTGFVISDKFVMDITYLVGSPEYEIENKVFNTTVKSEMEHSIISINFGIVF